MWNKKRENNMAMSYEERYGDGGINWDKLKKNHETIDWTMEDERKDKTEMESILKEEKAGNIVTIFEDYLRPQKHKRN